MTTSSLIQLMIRLRFSLCVVAGFLMLSTTSAFAQTAIPCGQLTTGAITTTGQENRYNFSGTAGDTITLRIVTSTNNFTPQLQLLFGAQSVTTSTGAVNVSLAQTGTYTIAVRYNSGSSQTGTYQLIFQRTKNACSAIQLSGCQTVKGTVSGPADLRAFTFNGTSGQNVTLQLRPLTTNFDISSELELYDPDGTFVASSSSSLSGTLPNKTGTYTVLVGTNLSNGMAGNFMLTLGNIAVLLTTPNGGEIFLAGTTAPIKWLSIGLSPSLASHDILLSTNGGVSFPTAIASGLSASTQSFDWHISPLLSTNNMRIRVAARDSGGGVCQDNSDANFTVAGLSSTTPVSYKYDELSRLTQAVYDDGTGITYTYDAAGNRLTEVVGPVPFYRVSCNPTSLTATLGGSATSTCIVTSLNGFNSPVSLGCVDTPSGVTCGFSTSTVTPPANGAFNSTLTVNLNSSVPPGTFAFRANGTGGGYTRSSNMRLAVSDFTIRCSPSSLTAAAGGNTLTTCTLSSLNGFTSSISLGCPNAPAGVTCSAIPAATTLAANSSMSTTLNISVATTAALTTSSFPVAATGGSAIRTANVTLTVKPLSGGTTLLNENFSSGIPATWTVVHGGTATGAAATWTTGNPGGRSIGTPFSGPFAIVDSDAAGSGFTQDEQLVTPTFNASGCNRVILDFSNQFRRFSGEIADVDVSTNNGSSWTNVLRMQSGNDGYPTANAKSIDITSAIASNPSTVKIRFRYYNASFAWWWAIDNVSVRCLPVFGQMQFNTAGYGASEATGSAQITVSRSGDTSSPATIDYSTADGSGKQRTDYITAAGTLSFAAGEMSKSFAILIVDNVYVDGNRTVNLILSNPSGALSGTPIAAVLTIADNDTTTPTTNPLDNADARFFVRQHYYDFLSRVPDQGGFDFWSGQITQCGSNQTCIRTKKIDVSNAFFYELEYQQTAAYVFRLYRSAFGNSQPFPNPDNSNQTEVNKLPSYAAFSQDRARLVGGANLALDQLALANLFVTRPEFLNKYPANLTLDQFVDAVLASIRSDNGVDLASQRTALIGLGSRGAVMYRLADDNLQANPINNRAFIDAEYNRSFVASQYFGYLRRDPDIGGFLFWLSQVASAPLRDVPKQHAMVCSFTTSAEYQQRFSSVVTHSNQECGN